MKNFLTEILCAVASLRKSYPRSLSSGMQNDLLLILSLLSGTLMLVTLGQGLRISYPIFLVGAEPLRNKIYAYR
jgi:hypothetical protein